MAAPIFTDEGGNTLRITATECMLRQTDDINDVLYHYEIAQQDLTIPNNSGRYIGIQYNAGSPNYIASATDVWNNNTEFRIANVYNEGGTIHIWPRMWRAANFQNWVNERWREVEGVRRAGSVGLALGESGGTRYVTLSAGTLYEAMEEYTISSIDTSGADTFDIYYRDGASGWTKVSAQSTWPGTQYDNNSGTLQTMTASFYSTFWWYLDTDGNLVGIYGQSEHADLGDALSALPPTDLPDRLEFTTILIGSFVFKKSTTPPTVIRNTFEQLYGGASVDHHHSLAGLTDDDHTQYVMLAGRDNGQTIHGGNQSAGGSLYLHGNAQAALAGTIEIGGYAPGYGQIIVSELSGGITMNGTLDLRTCPLGFDWDAGSYQIRAETFRSDVTTGTAPFTVASTTKVANLNADSLDGRNGAAYAILAGQAGGQTLYGGTNSGDDLTLHSTSHATKGDVWIGNSVRFAGDQILAQDGTSVAPAYSFDSATGAGMYYGSSDLILKNSATVTLDATGLTLSSTDQFVGSNGTNSAPTYGFTGGLNDYGMYLTGTELSFSCNGTRRWYMNTSAQLIGTATGSASLPAIAIGNDPDTGLYSYGADKLAITVGGNWRFAVDDTNHVRTNGLLFRCGSSGSAAFPAYSWSTDTNTGMYRDAADTIGFSTGGTARFGIDGTYITCARTVVPSSAAGYNLGNATYYWNDISYKTATDRGCIVEVDKQEAKALLKKAKGVEHSERTPMKKYKDLGMKILRYKDFPSWCYDDGKHIDERTGEELQGEEGLDISAVISLLISLVKDQDERLDALEAEVAALKKRK
jgi:hypothetical protein